MEMLDGDTADNYVTTVCVDDGKGYLKATLNRVRRGEVAMRKKRGKEVPVNDDRGVTHSQVRNTVILSCISSQKLYFLPQIIFVVGGVKESYSNLRTLFALLDLKASKNCKIVMDLKCANLALGLQTARAR